MGIRGLVWGWLGLVLGCGGGAGAAAVGAVDAGRDVGTASARAPHDAGRDTARRDAPVSTPDAHRSTFIDGSYVDAAPDAGSDAEAGCPALEVLGGCESSPVAIPMCSTVSAVKGTTLPSSWWWGSPGSCGDAGDSWAAGASVCTQAGASPDCVITHKVNGCVVWTAEVKCLPPASSTYCPSQCSTWGGVTPDAGR